MFRCFALMLLGIVALGGTSHAEDAAPGTLAGARVRLRAPTVAEGPLVGQVLAEDASTLTLAVGKATRTIPRNALTTLEVSRERSRRGHGAGLGALTGGLIGAALGALSGEDCSSSSDFICFDRGTTAVFGILLFAPAGAIVGAVVAPGEKWEPVTSQRVRMSFAPLHRGAAVALSVSF